MRVLYLCPMVPYPTTDGGRQRLHYLLLALLAEHEVFFAAMSAENEQTADWPLAGRFAAPPVVVRVDTPAQTTPPAILTPGPLTPSTVRRAYGSALWDRLLELPLESIDVVHLESAALAGYGLAIKARYPRVRLVFDAVDVVWLTRVRMALSVPQWWRKRVQLQRMLEALKWYWFERTTISRYDWAFACSEEDKKRLNRWIGEEHIDVIPNCADVSAGSLPQPPKDSKVLVFVGMMSYGPNVEGVDFFCRTVWPLVRAAEPQAEFWIVGKGVSEETRALGIDGNGVHVTGMVPDVRPYLERAIGTVVPLLSGGGTRLKILEAMAAGRAVLSTSIGAEGIEAVGSKEILYADTAQALAEGCLALIRQPDLRDRIAAGGRQLAVRKYDWREAQRTLLNCYSALLTCQR